MAQIGAIFSPHCQRPIIFYSKHLHDLRHLFRSRQWRGGAKSGASAHAALDQMVVDGTLVHCLKDNRFSKIQ